jgi:hypothetical protein
MPVGGFPFWIGNGKLDCDAGLASVKDEGVDDLLSPVSRRLLVGCSGPRSRGRSRLRFELLSGDGTCEDCKIPSCCLRAISFANIEGRSEYNCCIRSIDANSTKAGHSIIGSEILR